MEKQESEDINAALKRIESELREIKTILMILVPSYGDMEKKAAEIFGWNKEKESGMVSHAKTGRNIK